MITDDKKIEFVVSSFHDLENKLIDCMNYIPFIEQNQNTISPKFVPIILEACSLIESVFKDTLGDGKFNFKDYSKNIEKDLELSETVSLLLTSPIQFLEPFKNWDNEIPIWWNIYNKLKHDRLNNFHLVTYNSTVLAIAALHQLISKHRAFTNHIVERCWVHPDSEMIPEIISARVMEAGIPINVIACESELFVSPLDQNFAEKKEHDFNITNECDFSNKVRIKILFSEFGL